jgi:hypothetical protein
VDSHQPPLNNSPSPFILPSWEALLSQYPGSLPVTLAGILKYGCQLGYNGPLQFILSQNLKSAYIDQSTISDKLTLDLALRRVVSRTPSFPFISSPLGLVPKGDGGLRRIHHLSYPQGSSVNAYILESASSIKYISITDIYKAILLAGHHCVIVKKDIKDAFRNIPIAPNNQWLMGFSWNGQYYSEACLPFGLSTAPAIFNLFAEAFHWILESWLLWTVFHYLDDFIRIIPAAQATPKILAQSELDYHALTDLLGIPENTKKDASGTIVTALGITLNTNNFQASLSVEKIAKAIKLTATALQKRRMTLLEVQTIGGYLSWCSEVVRLGKVYLHHIWQFLASFPPSAKPSTQLAIPYIVRLDFMWWHTLLPQFNGIYLFQEDRPKVSLFSDASQKGLGAFFLPTPKDLVRYENSIQQENSFSMLVKGDHLGQHINILELHAIQAAFLTWAQEWSQKTVIMHTDSEVAFWALTNHKAYGPAFYPLRHILLLASTYDIIIKPVHIPGITNEIADALSRFKWAQLANLCPHWQFPYPITPFPRGFKDLSPPPLMHGQSSYITDLPKALEIHIEQPRSNTNSML